MMQFVLITNELVLGKWSEENNLPELLYKKVFIIPTGHNSKMELL